MVPGIQHLLRGGAMAVTLAAIAAGCSSSLRGPDGGGGNGGSGGGGGGGTGGTGGTTGGICGGFSATTCAQGQGCLWECFGDGPPQCVALPTACDSLLKPVCGCDGATYANECLLQRAAVRKDHDGECAFTSIPPSASGDAELLTGVWSGAGIRMNVTEAGADISFGCTVGTIKQPLVVARFSYTVAGPLSRRGSWQGTFNGASVTYDAVLSSAILELRVLPDQFWVLQHQDVGALPCP